MSATPSDALVLYRAVAVYLDSPDAFEWGNDVFFLRVLVCLVKIDSG